VGSTHTIPTSSQKLASIVFLLALRSKKAAHDEDDD
jgi:hypothetical protein